ncbi:MAG: acyltransferase family protein [Candidatus Onthomonas sp.]
MTFSKHDTLIVKGVAIFMLICYHCFSVEKRLMGYTVSFAPLSAEQSYHIFWAMYVCVGMFVFLSAFGLTRILKGKRANLRLSPLEQLQFTTKRLFSALFPFLFTAICCVAVTYLWQGVWPYGTGTAGMLNLLADLFGLSGILGTPMAVGTWWYMGFVWVMLLLFPLMLELYRRFGALSAAFVLLLPVLFTFQDVGYVRSKVALWITVVPFGILFADYNLLERWKQKQLSPSPVVSKLLKLLLMVPAIVVMGMLFRSSWGRSHLSGLIASVFSVLCVAFVYEFLVDIPILSRILHFIGQHSAYIFYIHTFIRYQWCPEIAYSFGHWLPIALFILLSSIVCSYFVQLLQRLLHWDRLSAFLCDKLLQLEKTLLPDRESAG